LGDLPGPKIRLGNIDENKYKKEKLTKEQKIYLNFGKSEIDCPTVLINDLPFNDMVKKIDDCQSFEEFIYHKQKENQKVRISLGDGEISLNATAIKDNIVTCIVEHVRDEGNLRNKMGLTLGGSNLEVRSSFENDKLALDFLLEHCGDFLGYVGVSFVKNANDILNVKYYIEKIILAKLKAKLKDKSVEEIKENLIYKRITKQDLSDKDKYEGILKIESRLRAPLVIAKIETNEAWENIDEIIDVADIVMVARGDLALQKRPEDVPVIQKEIIRKCNLRGKPVITATEMLSSMEKKPKPTRAEANDVFNAVLDGTSAVMLSGETSSGQYPAHAVEMMVDIVKKSRRVLL
jgi:pyruvate kinase